MKHKSILITGGAGFIGSALARNLIKDNEVTSLDNYFSGSELNHIEGVEYIKGNVAEIDSILKNKKYDLIYHLGEYARVEQSYDDYSFVKDFNIISFSSMLDFAKKSNSKIIYSGSSTKFGSYFGDETDSPYSWSKKKNTEHLKLYSEWFGLDYAITYFYNVYGEGEINKGKYSTVVAKFLESYKNNEEALKVVSPGTQTRNFTHIEDIVSALVIIGEKGSGDDYGIGSDESYSILDLADMVGLPIKMEKERRGNRLDGDLITEKTKKLGWECKKNLKDYIQNFKSNLKD
tara:strand:- start:334 stop:1203 length:870 start_codon:yes stop_codon:yes gene_type:complete